MRKIFLLASISIVFGAVNLAAGPAVTIGASTTHGGSVVSGGSANVMINGQPAAKVGSVQSCPQTTSGTPHGGGPITTGSTTVLINGAPAAVHGSAATCNGPSPTIIGNSPNVNVQ